MAIVPADLLIKLSVKTGAAGNSTAGTPAGSLGKYISTTQLSATALGNLFDNVSGAENAASEAEYRCAFLHNNHASLTLENAVVWLTGEVAGGAVTAIGVDPTAISAIGASAAQALEVANEDTAPTGVTFSAPGTQATGLALGNIPAGSCKAFWVRRTAGNTAAVSGDGATLNVGGDTAA